MKSNPKAVLTINSVNEVVTDPGDAEGTIMAPIFDVMDKTQILADINTMGIKRWIMARLLTWLNQSLRAFFTGKVAGGAAPSAPTGELTWDNLDERVNYSLANDFVITFDQGIPQVSGRP